ncbi:MAG: HNH endonuclease [Terriglobia bacterium]
MASIPDTELQEAVRALGERAFSTYDFVLALKRLYPGTWRALEKRYGAGGAGAGKEYTAYTRAAQALGKFANAAGIVKLNYRSAPEGYGNAVIRYWASTTSRQDFPDDVPVPEAVTEGAKQVVTVNRYERSLSARVKCIEEWGVNCVVCGFNFEQTYGSRGAGYIHVHHLKPLGEIGTSYKLDPIKDLRPVCPNCHAMLHRTIPAISVSDLKRIISGKKI